MKITVPGKISSLIFLILVSLIFCDASHAETGYVSDMLILTMRNGPGSNYNVVQTLRSNAVLKILEKGKTHFKVRTVAGDEGWVEKQYITLEIPKTMVIDKLNLKIADLEKSLAASQASNASFSSGADTVAQEYQEQIVSLETSLKEIQAENKALQGANTRLESVGMELKTAIDALKSSVESGELITENEALKKEVATLTQKLNAITASGDEPLKTGMIKWFVSGAGVLLAGWLMGKSMTGSRKKSGRLLS
ncbi:MAG: TIGR04211 family SH3 domain-containing protein [Desulfobacterium sp.]